MAVEAGRLNNVRISGSREHKEYIDIPFWDNARRILVSGLLKRFSAGGLLLDVGCGAGTVWPGFCCYALDCDPEETKLAAEKGLNTVCADARDLPFDSGWFGTLLMLDILEHIKSPSLAIREAYRVLGSGGILVASVPLHPELWSRFDESVGHVCRYRPGELCSLMEAAGFQLLYKTCWNLPGLPGAIIRKAGLDVRPRLAGPILEWEARLAARVPSPLGLTEFCVARKQQEMDAVRVLA